MILYERKPAQGLNLYPADVFGSVSGSDLRLPKTCAAIIQYPQSLHRICHTASRAGSGDAYLLLELVSLNAKLLGLLAKFTGSSSLWTVACRCRGKHRR